MSNQRSGLEILLPSGWDDVIVRTVKVLIAGFLALVLKEWMETREFDLPACATDATWVAGGTVVLNAILQFLAPKRA